MANANELRAAIRNFQPTDDNWLELEHLIDQLCRGPLTMHTHVLFERNGKSATCTSVVRPSVEEVARLLSLGDTLKQSD